MSDTVKLIIEIPKDYYEVLSKTEVILTSQRSGKTFMSVIYSAVKNGIPLDDVKAEIADIYCGQYCENPPTADSVREMILDILDNIGKAESEE